MRPFKMQGKAKYVFQFIEIMATTYPFEECVTEERWIVWAWIRRN